MILGLCHLYKRSGITSKDCECLWASVMAALQSDIDILKIWMIISALLYFAIF